MALTQDFKSYILPVKLNLPSVLGSLSSESWIFTYALPNTDFLTK